MKKIVALLLALLMLLALVACDIPTGDNNDPSDTDEGNETSEKSSAPEFRLPQNVKYTYKSVDDDYQDLTVTKIGDEFCIVNHDQLTFYRKNAEGTYDYWLRMDEGWTKFSTFEEDLFFISLLGISPAAMDFDTVEKVGTATVCGLSADVYKSKYLQNNETYIHSGNDGVFVVKTVVGSTVIEITEWTTENVEFTVEKPE